MIQRSLLIASLLLLHLSLATFAQPVRQRVLPRTLVFPRKQSKYNLFANYLHRWVDRPLFFDRRTGDTDQPYAVVACPSFRRNIDIARAYGVDGLGMITGSWMINRPLDEAFDCLDAQSDADFKILMCVAGLPANNDAQIADAVDAIAPALERTLASASAMRVGGKVLLSSYSFDRAPLDGQRQVFNALRERFGDTFLVAADMRADVYAIHREYENNGNALSAETTANFEQKLRDWLDVFDGVMFAGANHLAAKATDRLDRAFYRDCFMPMFVRVLNEPPYRGKLFGLSAAIGYINVTTSRNWIKEEGTRHLRDTFDIAISGNPDFIVMPEWDETNENTCIQPTLCNSLSTQRIVRHYTRKLAGEPPAPMPGDDIAVPNLVVSCRPYVMLGEPIEIEVLNIPDGTLDGAYRVRLELKDIDDNIVHTFDEQTLDAARLIDHTFTVPGESLAMHTVVTPSLTVTAPDGTTTHWQAGLECIRLRATWNINYKWTKTPLRDMVRPSRASFAFADEQPGEGVRVSGIFACDEPIMSVEVIQDECELYAVDPRDEFALRPGEALIKLQWQSMRNLPMTGRIFITGGSLRHFRSLNAPLYKPEAYLLGTQDDSQTIEFTSDLTKLNCSKPRGGYMLVTNAQDAVFHMHTSHGNVDVPMRQLLASGVRAQTFSHGLTIELRHFRALPELPYPILKNEASFDTVVHPSRPYAPLQMRVVTESGRIYRSEPLVMQRPDGESIALPLYSEARGEVMLVDVVADRIVNLNYDLSDAHGSSIHAPGQPDFHGLAGGVPMYSAAFAPSKMAREYPADAAHTKPTWTTEDGRPCRRFDGKSNFILFPPETLPRGAFTMSFTIKPTSDQTQMLCTTRGYHQGCFQLLLIDGKLEGSYIDHAWQVTPLKTGLEVPVGSWSDVTVSYDLRQFVFEVNGKRAVVPCAGRGGTYQPLIFGGRGKTFFEGYLRSLHITHQPLAPD